MDGGWWTDGCLGQVVVGRIRGGGGPEARRSGHRGEGQRGSGRLQHGGHRPSAGRVRQEEGPQARGARRRGRGAETEAFFWRDGQWGAEVCVEG